MKHSITPLLCPTNVSGIFYVLEVSAGVPGYVAGTWTYRSDDALEVSADVPGYVAGTWTYRSDDALEVSAGVPGYVAGTWQDFAPDEPTRPDPSTYIHVGHRVYVPDKP